MNNKRFIISVNGNETASNLKTVGHYEHLDNEYLFNGDGVRGYVNSELKLKCDLIIYSGNNPNGWHDYEWNPSIINRPWPSKHTQQARLAMVLPKYKDFVPIPTCDSDVDFIGALEPLHDYFLSTGYNVKVLDSANGDSQKFYDLDDYDIESYRHSHNSKDFLVEQLGEGAIYSDGTTRDQIVQPKLKVMAEWRLIYLGDTFLVAPRILKEGGGATVVGQKDPYKFLNDMTFMDTTLEDKKFKGRLFMIAKDLKIPIHSSMDLACIETRDGFKWTFFEYQPQYGTIGFGRKMLNYCHEHFIENVINPKLKELGLL